MSYVYELNCLGVYGLWVKEFISGMSFGIGGLTSVQLLKKLAAPNNCLIPINLQYSKIKSLIIMTVYAPFPNKDIYS